MQNYLHRVINGTEKSSFANDWNDATDVNSPWGQCIASLHACGKLEKLKQCQQDREAQLAELGIASYLQQLEHLNQQDLFMKRCLIYNAAVARAKRIVTQVTTEHLTNRFYDITDSGFPQREVASLKALSTGQLSVSDSDVHVRQTLPCTVEANLDKRSRTLTRLHDLMLRGSHAVGTPSCTFPKGNVFDNSIAQFPCSKPETIPNPKLHTIKKVKARVVKHKAKDKPKRPLSAYNIFFKDERANILAQIPGDNDHKPLAKGVKKSPHRKIGFEDLAKIISQRWHALDADQLEYYKSKASLDMSRYKSEMKACQTKQRELQQVSKLSNVL